MDSIAVNAVVARDKKDAFFQHSSPSLGLSLLCLNSPPSLSWEGWDCGGVCIFSYSCLCCITRQHSTLRRRNPSSLFCMHGLTDTHYWLVTFWARGRQRGQDPLHPKSMAHFLLGTHHHWSSLDTAPRVGFSHWHASHLHVFSYAHFIYVYSPLMLQLQPLCHESLEEAGRKCKCRLSPHMCCTTIYDTRGASCCTGDVVPW